MIVEIEAERERAGIVKKKAEYEEFLKKAEEEEQRKLKEQEDTGATWGMCECSCQWFVLFGFHLCLCLFTDQVL